MAEKNHQHGHRQRLKKRFRETNGDGFADYEILELLLMLLIPRKDVKPIAKALLRRAGKLHKVMDMDEKDLKGIDGIGEQTAFRMQVLSTFITAAKREAVLKKPTFRNKVELLSYLYDKMSPLKHEEFHVLYFDSKNHLITEKTLFKGTIDSSAVYPREVMRHALDLGASQIVLVHNHPSGDPSPSQDDDYLTEQIRLVASPLNVNVQDHIIIGDGLHYSYKDQGRI